MAGASCPQMPQLTSCRNASDPSSVQAVNSLRAWECALLVKLRDELKAGNLSVHYNNHGDPNTQKPVLSDRMELNKFIEFL